jgi:hypothetical protein
MKCVEDSVRLPARHHYFRRITGKKITNIAKATSFAIRSVEARLSTKRTVYAEPDDVLALAIPGERGGLNLR